jgi:hypothetical protein
MRGRGPGGGGAFPGLSKLALNQADQLLQDGVTQLAMAVPRAQELARYPAVARLTGYS